MKIIPENSLRIGNASNFTAGWQILEASIPSDERRSLEQQQALLDPRYEFLTFILSDGGVCAVVGVWHFEQFTFIEHIAVSSEYRNLGIGARIISDLCQRSLMPVVLESDLPGTDSDADRRIKWYRRLNFVVNDFDYVQPPYSPEKGSVQMKLLSFPEALLPATFEEIVGVLYSEVYKSLPCRKEFLE